MSKLLRLIEENPSSAGKFIGISYGNYKKFLKTTADFSVNQAAEYFPKLNFTTRMKNYIQRLIKEPKYISVPDELALIPDEVQKSSDLSYPEKILLVLFCLNQNWTKEMANQIGVCEAAVLSFYFDTTEAAISEVFYHSVPLLHQLSSKGLLKVDLAEACSRILNASIFFMMLNLD